MAKKPQVDIRKLKDEVAEHLKKSRWEKAAEVPAEVGGGETEGMTLRLQVGDTYRKVDQPQMAIEAYRHAAKFFGDEGQLIKAIGAAKIILEIDPRNAEALKQLGDMNKRRLGRISLARIPAPTNHPAAAGRRQGAIELGDSPGTSADLVMTTGIDLPAGGEDEPLELDDGRSIKSPSFRSSMAALAPTPPDEPAGGELELDLGGSPPTEPPSISAEDDDLDRAFGNIAPPASAPAPKIAAKKVPLFDDLPQDAFVALVNRLGYHRHLPGHLIIREGDPGRSFFIIVEGRVRVYKAGPEG